MHRVELFHKFSSRILQNVSLCPDRHSLDQDQTEQTEQTVQSDVGFTLSVNLWDIYFVRNITLKWQYSGMNNIFNFYSAGYD